MSADRELLELAAKGAGLDDGEWQDMEGWGEVRHGFSHAIWSKTLNEAYGTGYWNPLTEDGDAFRLAVKLNFNVCKREHEVEIFNDDNGEFLCSISISEGDDPYAATRRAIVIAAAIRARGEAV